MSRHHEPGRDWHSIEEQASPPRTRRSQKRRRLKLAVLIGSVSGLLLVLVVAAALRENPPPPIPVPAPEPAAKAALRPKPAPPPPAVPATPAEQMKELADREKAAPRTYRTHYRAWDAFRKTAPPEALETAREQMERLQSAATKEYRVLW